MRGYLEFSFNYSEQVSDAQSYFPMFFHFNQWFWDLPNKPSVMYHFELEGAHFGDAQVPVDGFTSTVWITTSVLPSENEARKTWGLALDLFVEYLKCMPVKPNYRKRLY
jgi:hypothetical protein